MKIIPSAQNFQTWAASAPTKGDLLFSPTKKSSWLRQLHVPILSKEEIREQAALLWNLNHRSWYGYALGNTKAGAWLPRGKLETLDPFLLEEIAASQIKAGNPSLVRTKYISKHWRNKMLPVKGHLWITSKVLSKSSREEKIVFMRAWHKQNGINNYSSVKFTSLSAQAKKTLKLSGLAPILNSFADSSGPNCFAAVCAAICAERNLALQWLHWSPFEKFLIKRGYIKKLCPPLAGDILIFKRNNSIVHAAFCLNENIYFEKPGQDFYEPYRAAHLKNWAKDWPGCQLQAWAIS